jgi:endonuclease III related protein
MPTFDAVHQALVDHLDLPQSEFEGLAPFEAMIAVLLARTLGPSSWSAAIDALGESGLVDPGRLAVAEVTEIRDALREKGIALSPKTLAPLRNLARWLVRHHDGSVDALFDPHRSAGYLRGELAGIKGIGMAGADAILLHALRRPSYPVDRATYRVMVRHGWLDPTATYDEARDTIVDHAIGDVDVLDDHQALVLSELSHGLDQLGRRWCRATVPHCEGCPLERLLPEGGPREIEA